MHDPSTNQQRCKVPSGTHSFRMKIYPNLDYEPEPPRVRVSPGSFPAGLTSVKFEGCSLLVSDDASDDEAGITTCDGLRDVMNFTAQFAKLADAGKLLR